jgi:purine-cytosine permease-like protein
MTSTDEMRNDDAEDAYAPPRIRRSTYTPPPQYRDLVGPSDPSLLDDEPSTDVASPVASAPAVADAPIAAPEAAPSIAIPPAAPVATSTPTGTTPVPRRRSLRDEELLSALDAPAGRPGGTLGAIGVLESEMLLREEEVQQYRDWEASMLAVGTAEAIAVVERVRPEFTAIVIPPELTPTQQMRVLTAADIAAASAPASAVQPVTPPRQQHADLEQRPDTDTDTGLDIVRGSARAPAPAPTPTPTEAPEPEPEPEARSRVAAMRAEAAAADSAPAFALELSGLEPTELEQRAGRASRLFWLWFAANSSVVSVAFGAVVFSLGMSLRQSIVATLAGVALSFIPLGLGTLAGKRSGQPTVVVSRAAFGVAGNIVPALLALVSRVFWGAVLLWVFAASVATVVAGGAATGGLVIVFIVVGVMVAVVVAFLGYFLLVRFQLVVSVLSGLLIVGFVAATVQRVDLTVALSVPDGSWVLVVTGAILVFSFVGLVWANSSSDLARYQRPASLGGANMLWATFGAAVPTFLLIAYGALLAASDPAVATGLSSRPIETLQSLVPWWYAVPLIGTIAVSLLSAVVVTVYSGAFALQGVGLRIERQRATLVVGTLLAVFAVLFSVLSADLTTVFRDLATTLAVPVAAWAGIFAADTMIRNHPFHTPSLLGRGGVYPDVNWINLPALLVVTLVGWGLTTAAGVLLQWQGYLFALAGVPLDSDLAGSDLGVVVALVLGLLVPIVSGVPAIRRQESAVAHA